VGTVPEHVETRGRFPTFGHQTGVKGEDVLVVGNDDIDDGSAVETDKIRVMFKPSGKGFLVIQTIMTQIAERVTRPGTSSIKRIT